MREKNNGKRYPLCGAARYDCGGTFAAFAHGGQRTRRASFKRIYRTSGLSLRIVRRRRGLARQFAGYRVLRFSNCFRSFRFGILCKGNGGRGPPPRALCARVDPCAFSPLRGRIVCLRKADRRASLFFPLPDGRQSHDFARSDHVRFRGIPCGGGYARGVSYGHGQGKAGGFLYADSRTREICIAIFPRTQPFAFRRRGGNRGKRVLSGCFLSRFVLYYKEKTGKVI